MTVEEDSKGRRRWKPPIDARAPIDGRTMAKKEKVRKKTLSKTSKEWVDRQLRDPYVRRAQEAGYRARSAYKLIEIDEKFHILKRGARVIDLGCAPGGWLQVVFEKGAVAISGVDLLPTDPVGTAKIFLGDIAEPGMTQKLLDAIDGTPTLVLSDMAANTSGHKQTDHVRTVGLGEIAAQFAVDNLSKGGAFICKVFQGGAQGELLELLKANFADVRHWKPPASRQESPETFVIATGFKGR
ncbi:MAG TPA: RlmE family RNA methyltransferase [Hyphomonadaceae bacterium]|jgi:23S rRNA (uridine2552-2'-O)-methyltransferase|nr:RlmE family RNA methyltransferase [Hyphomonadaceae bacterium]